MADELYSFNNNSVYYTYTPTIFSKTFNGRVYSPAIVSRSAIKVTDNFSKSPVTFTFDAFNVFARSLLEEIPEYPITVTIYKAGLTYWTGYIISASRKSLPYIEVVCDSAFSTDVKNGQRYRMNLHCNHKMYSTGCTLQEFDFVVLGTTIAGSTALTVPELTQPTGYFNNGEAVMDGQRRRIVESNNTFIKLATPFSGVLSGIIALYPGCLGTREQCIAYNNLPNGLFFHKQSSKNPYGNTGLL